MQPLLRRIKPLLTVLFAFCVATFTVRADNTWYGESTNSDDWTTSNPTNWGGSGTAVSGDANDVNFHDQQKRDYSNYNYGGNNHFRSMIFDSTLPRFMKLYTSTGSTMDLFGSIVNNSFHNIEFDVKVFFRTNDSHIESNNSNTDFFADVDLNAQTIHFLGSNHDIYMHNAITSAAGGGSIVLDSSFMNVHLYNSGDSYSGQTTINFGQLYNEADNVIPDASVLYVGGSGIYNKNGKTETVDSITGSGSIVLGSTGILTYGGNTSQTYSGTFTGSAGVTKNGSGTWTLSGDSASTYSGITTVTNGTLLVNNTSGSATGSGNVNITGGTLAGGTTNGTGGVAGAVTISSAANLSPGTSGNGIGTTAVLHTGALTLQTTSNYRVDLNGATLGSGYDQTSVTGSVTITGANLLITVATGFTPTTQPFVIVSNDGIDSVVGTFGSISGLPSGYVIDYLYNDSNGSLVGGNDIALVPIPEPSTWIAGILAVGAIGFVQRRRVARLLRLA